MIKCSSCGRELHIVVENHAKVYCNLCAEMKKNPDYPRKTLLQSLDDTIKRYESALNNDIERFIRISKEPFNFEQSYALSGAEGRINDLRNTLYWLKQNKKQLQPDVVESIE